MNRSNQTDGLVVVHARDEVNQALANHGGREYTSPPHQRADALALVALLLERPVKPDEHDQTSWTRPLAGGQRTITLGPVPRPTPARSGYEPVRLPAGSSAANPTSQLGRRGVAG